MQIEGEEVPCNRCGMSYIDVWMDAYGFCGDCRSEIKREVEARRLSRHERLQRLADGGCDTWEEYNQDR